MKRVFRSLIAGALALPLFAAGQAAAQGEVLDQNKVGSALATLIITDDATSTYTSTIVTNTSATDEIVLAAEVISGDPNDNWTGQSFRCPMSPGETTQFVFSPVDAETSELTYECSIPGANEFSDPADLSQAKTMQVNAAKGIMWLSIEGAGFPNPTLSKNVLEGKSVVLNYLDGNAYEVGAVPFQAPDPGGQDFDTSYEFDGREYARFPESLTASFHAPTGDGEIQATLILFALDGRLSSHHTPNAEAVVYFFNDDEEFHNTSLYFDCFAMLDLEDIDSRFLKDNLGSQVGHLEIIPQSVDPNDENHDGRFGTDDNARYVGILGWIVQVIDAGDLMDAHGNAVHGAPVAGQAAWGSLLTTSLTALPNETGDVPALTR